jgi:putative transposase
MLERDSGELSIVRQCELLDLPRSSVYYQPVVASQEDLHLMKLLDEQYLLRPFYGSRRMCEWLQQQGYRVNRKRIQRLMRELGIEALYPKPSASSPSKLHKVWPYLLRGVDVEKANQVWAADITYVPMSRGYLYLVAIIDWHSRYVLSWRLSNTLDTHFCTEALEEALTHGCPEIFNTDQGSQFTSEAFTSALIERGVKISMDGKGRYLDNIFVERLWRSLKYEEIYLKGYANGIEAAEGIRQYFQFFNEERLHQSLRYQTPKAVWEAGSLRLRLESLATCCQSKKEVILWEK